MDKNIEEENTWNQSETLYAFCGWLTCQNEATIMGAKYDAAPVVKRIIEFMTKYKLPDLREDWYKQIIPEND
jgi:hypothetical protein